MFEQVEQACFLRLESFVNILSALGSISGCRVVSRRLTNKNIQDPFLLLAGTSLRVYLYMLRKGAPVGVREVQRALGFRSPSTAKHHLDRLVELGLAEVTSGGYIAKKPKGLLALYVRLAGTMVPRLTILASIATGSTIAYAFLPKRDILALGILATITIWLWYETINMLRAVKALSRL